MGSPFRESDHISSDRSWRRVVEAVPTTSSEDSRVGLLVEDDEADTRRGVSHSFVDPADFVVDVSEFRVLHIFNLEKENLQCDT